MSNPSRASGSSVSGRGGGFALTLSVVSIGGSGVSAGLDTRLVKRCSRSLA